MKLDEIKKWYIENKKVYFASIELTQKCNFRCKHCYCTDKCQPNLDLESYKRIIDKIYDTGCLFLNFTGGEIFTNRDFIDIYLYAKNKGFIIDLLTNISLLSPEILSVLQEYPPNCIAVTIYGTNPHEYGEFTGDDSNYFKVMEALRQLKQNNIHFVLRTVATKTYYSSLFAGQFQNIADRFHSTFKYDPIVFPQTSGNRTPLEVCLSSDEIVSLESQSAERAAAWKNEITNNHEFKWSCKAGFNSFSVDCKGDAYICGLYRERPISILQHSTEEVLTHLRKIHDEHLKIVASNECSQCVNRKICKWCPAYSRIYNGNDDSKIPFFCDLASKRVKVFGQ